MDSNGHDWVALVQYELTPEDALRFINPAPDDPGEVTQVAADDPPAPEDQRPFLGGHNLRHEDVAIVCMNCELAATKKLIESPCTKPGDYTKRPTGTNVKGMFAGVGRNDKCPCGSGKKFKHCHGR